MKPRFDFDRLTADELRRLFSNKITAMDTLAVYNRVTVGGIEHLTPPELDKYGDFFREALWAYIVGLFERRDAAAFETLLADVKMGDGE